jgi:tetratricopeptide (TPR) repeat protein
MDSSKTIKIFLNRIHRRRKGLRLVQGVLQFLTLALTGALIGNLIAYFSDNPRPFLTPFLILLATLLAIGLILLLIRGLFFKSPLHETALWVENKVEGLNNSLVSSVQLEPQLSESSSTKTGLSQDMIRELIQRTGQRIQTLKINEIVSRTPLFQSGRWTAGIFLIALTVALLLPDFMTRGYKHWLEPPALAKVVQDSDSSDQTPATPENEIQYSIDHLDLTFNFPAYTRKKSVTHNPSDGRIEVLPGTEVVLKGNVSVPIEGASLVLNGTDNLSMKVQNKTAMEGRFIVKEPGFYQFRLKSPHGEKSLLAEKYPITLTKDKAPRIIIFLANPKPVYYLSNKIQLFYEGEDDFGIHKIDLVIDIEGRIQRKTIKKIKGAQNNVKGGYTWELSTMDFRPGDRVHYYLEIEDNDNVFGPNTGQSEVFSFDVFDEQKQRQDLLALQEQLIDKMVSLLAVSLVTDITDLKNSPEGMAKLKQVLASSSNQLIEIIGLAQSIETQAKDIESFPQPYLTLLGNIISGFNEIRQDQIEAMNRITNAMTRATPIGLNFPPLESVHERLITHLERDILFLIKILNRERMEQALNLDQTLTELTESLREEFQKAKDKKGKVNTPQFKKALAKIKETLQQIMEQLSRQNQGLSDEFLNPNAFESLNMDSFSAALEKLMDLVNQGKIDEAMEELEKLSDDLRAFSEQLDNMDASQENMMDIQIMKKLHEALEKIGKLEEDQKSLLGQTTQLNKTLRSKQSEKFENRLEKFFADLRKDVQAILTILHKDERILDSHPDMKQLIELIDQQAKISERIQILNQNAIDSVGKSKLRGNFTKLNKARKQLSANMEQQQALQMKMFYGFRNYMPELLEKYNKLEEFTELMDLFEFSALFKNTYPEVFRWQNHFRTSRKLNPELLDQMKVDLLTITEINSEISKKLGTMIKQDYQNLISEKDKQDMQQMSGKQKGLRKQSDELSRMFSEMNQDNPMISPMLSHKMNSSGRHMKSAENRLQKSQIPESIESENKALRQLSETREMLDQLKEASQRPSQSRSQRTLRLGRGQAPDGRRGGRSTRMRQEKVNLPTEDQYKVPGQFREEILEAMKNKYPKQYERLVGEYYKEMVK